MKAGVYSGMGSFPWRGVPWANRSHRLAPGLTLPGFAAFLLLLLSANIGRAEPKPVLYIPSRILPPAPHREFRAGWVASVANIDWPSKPGLPVATQKAELIALLDRAAELRLNAIVFQVRPACDALYASKLEPWSPYLTGVMGKPPEPFYDPLAFAVAEAHQRGLELHAWFNPYRALHPSSKVPLSPNHISRTHPELVREYGEFLWLDPGERAVQDYSLRVVMDVVKRYDIDGVHFDDYFYPYKVKDAQNQKVDFPDAASWKRYGASGSLSREDWRRDNVNRFVERVYQAIKATKPWVKFGISPFGIWQPGHPAQIVGLNSYEELYCDSRKWLMNGWVDYCTPQLYWSVQKPETSYPALLKWWTEQNPLGRHLWPGLNSGNVGGKWTAGEIVNQIRITRDQSADSGHIHWSMKSLLQNRGSLASTLKSDLYSEPALVPASPWLERGTPGEPRLAFRGQDRFTWSATGKADPWLWVLQAKSGADWTTTILPGDARTQTFAHLPDSLALTAVDRCGVAGHPVVLDRSRVARSAN